MIRSLPFAAIVALAFATDAAAQAVTVPAGLTTPGNSSQTSNWRGGRRHQIVLDPRAVPPMNGLLRGIELRGDNGVTGGLPAQLDVTVLVSSIGVPGPGDVDRTSFVANLGSDATVAISARRIIAPATVGATMPLPFGQPFPYQNGNPLLLQIDFAPVPTPGIDNPVWVLDAHDLPTTFWGISGVTSGTACPAPGQWTVTSDSFGDQLVFRWGTAPGPQGLLALVLFGLSDQSFGGITLPLDLSLFGLPGCALRTSIDAVLPTTTVAGGGSSWVLVAADLPRDPRFTGFTFFAQTMVLDPGASGPVLQFSELRREQLATPPAPILATHALGGFSPLFANDVPAIVYRNRTLVLGLQ